MILLNTICQFTPIYPESSKQCHSKDYGSISVVLFKSHDVNSKDYSIYLHGLRKWITRMLPTFFSSFRFLLWVDQATLEDDQFKKLLKTIQKSKKMDVKQFECPEFMGLSKRHIDLFGTVIRFFPWFDFSNSICFGKRILTMDVEPSNDIYDQLKIMYELDSIYHKSVEGKKHPLDMMYVGKGRYDYNPVFQRIRKSSFPYSLSSLIYVAKRLPKKVLFQFLNRSPKENEWVYGPLKSRYSFGADELFLNLYVIPYAVKANYRIGIVCDFTIADGFYYFRELIDQDPMSQVYLETICQRKSTINKMIEYIDQTFYFQEYFQKKKFSKEQKQVVSRFWVLIETLVKENIEWMPIHYMKKILEKYEGKAQFTGLEVFVGDRLDCQISIN